MKVAVIGYGVDGEAAYRYWTGRGNDVTVHDADAERAYPNGMKVVKGPDYLKHLDRYDLVVRSPGVRPWLITTKAPVTSVTKEFIEQCPARIIGVTGTKGKGTTTTLIARILGEAGWRSWIGGNIGKPPLDFLDKVRANHWVVLEMSSFQLMDLDVSPHIAVCLMIVPEHMDWHRNIREYVAAKGNIFWHQEPGDLAIYNPQNEFSSEIAQLSPGEHLPYLEEPGAYVRDGRIMMDSVDICGTGEVGLLGPHNLENICAAITATWEVIEHNPEPVRRAVKSFTGLEHRLELVRELDGVHYYDDSFSTTPETAIAAVRSFEQEKVLILGGSDKKSDYAELGKALKASNVRKAVLIGQMAVKIRAALEAAKFYDVKMAHGNMAEIVELARGYAKPGDVVLLSPACASFDMFKDYRDRGNQFQEAVKALRSLT
jgi:UDP-N-acetylmuramoylalanine--D-glutamate ligase